MNALRSPVSEDEVHRMGDVLLFGGIAGRMLGTRVSKGMGMAKWFLSQTVGGDAAEALLKAIHDAPEGNSEEYVAAVAAAKQATEARLLETMEKVAQLRGARRRCRRRPTRQQQPPRSCQPQGRCAPSRQMVGRRPFAALRL